MKYVGADSSGKCWIDVSLTSDEENRCHMSFGNSIGDTPDAESTGLGAQLIKAFALQLGGDMTVTKTEDMYRVDITFTIADFSDDVVDY